MKSLHMDYETFSELDIRKVGGIRYSEDCEILMLGYAYENEEPKLWIPEDPRDIPEMTYTALICEGFIVQSYPPADLVEHLSEEDVLVYAHNADFERAVSLNQGEKLGLPHITSKQYRCTAAMCRIMALPASLDGAGMALKLFNKKDKAGSALITKYCKPKKPTKNFPETRRYFKDNIDDYIAFGNYCLQDVRTERAIHQKLQKFDLTPLEWDTYRMTSDVNFAGLPIDIETVKKCQIMVLQYQDKEFARCREMTKVESWLDPETGELIPGVPGIAPSQKVALKKWCNDRLPEELHLENTQAGTIDKIVKDEQYPQLMRDVLQLSRTVARASVKKIFPMTYCASMDNRIRGTLVYHGATTGRWTARLIQPHNLPRPKIKNTKLALDCLRNLNLEQMEFLYDDFMESVSSCIRHFIHCKPGHELIAADYSSIEARVLCFLAGQADAVENYQKDLDSKKAFQEGKITKEQRAKDKWDLDPYVDMAATVFGIPASEIDADFQRPVGKAIILGCGYGMGAKTFYETCLQWGLNITMKLAKQCVDSYRAKYYNITKFWYKIEECAIRAVKTGVPQSYSIFKMGMKDGYLFIRMPSGRKLAFPEAALKLKKTSWGELKNSIVFKGMVMGVKWGEVSTYGGKLVENIVQGAARDIMSWGMLNAEKAGYTPIGTVHDEGIAEVKTGEGSVEEYEKLLCDLPDWAKGMPIEADGFRSIMYRK